MKIPLRYQITEYDCGTVSILNALSYLYEREEIPPSLIYNINKYTLDEFNDEGEERKGGTSTNAIRFLAHWINSFARAKNFNIYCEILSGDDANINSSKVIDFINNRGVIIPRIWHGSTEHYALITKIDNNFVYVFDPYYEDASEYDNDSEIKMEHERPYEYNRIITLNRIKSIIPKDYALVNNQNRELLFIKRMNEK